MFRRILVANRGEIACRVLATCRRLGVEAVAVYSDADAAAPHVRAADQAVHLGPSPARQSYLDVEKVVAAATRSGAEAVHPGYGFLSENPRLAEACAEAGVVFVGPRADTIALMGDKAAAKRHLEAAGVPVVPGVDGDLDDGALADAAERLGYPLLVKPVAGGGGKGMRTVEVAADLEPAVAAARREATAAFGDGRLLLERYVAEPRHVEIQVLADAHGNVLHLFERECSIQRRHQKVIEETPSPALDPGLRAEMGEAAVTAAASVEYLGAGTVEFLVSDRDRSFHFLEMNTRLQVEHPVTEQVVVDRDGAPIDLVEWQLRVAAGERLPWSQADLDQRGHALEARLYAEDAAAGFLPQTGTVLAVDVPDTPYVRVDTGIEAGTEVSRFYDPMLAKLVVTGPDRAIAIERLAWLLRHTTVLGVTTNLEFLADVVDHPRFVAGDLTTGFVEQHLPGWVPAPTPDTLVMAAVAELLRVEERRRAPHAGDRTSPWRRMGPWRVGGRGGWHLRVEVPDHDRPVAAVANGHDGRYRVELDGRRADVTIVAMAGPSAARPSPPEAPALLVQVDDREGPARVVVDGDDVWVHMDGLTRRLRFLAATRHADAAMRGGPAAFTAPMPGAVVAVKVTEGEHVAAGAVLVVVEAMKMEHPVRAPVAGTVTQIHVAEGDPVDADTPLLAFEPDDEDTT